MVDKAKSMNGGYIDIENVIKEVDRVIKKYYKNVNEDILQDIYLYMLEHPYKRKESIEHNVKMLVPSLRKKYREVRDTEDISDIAYIMNYDDITIKSVTPDQFGEYIQSIGKPRCDYIASYFGIYGEPMIMKSIAKKVNKSQEAIRAQIHKGTRMLRHPGRYKYLDNMYCVIYTPNPIYCPDWDIVSLIEYKNTKDYMRKGKDYLYDDQD